MTTAQTNLYFREWGAVRKHYLTKGIDPKQADAKRHELHRKALGFDKSSKDFTNADLDKVLAAFYAITRPGDLDAQLHQQEQATNRISALLTRVRELSWQLGIKPGLESGYVSGIARNVFGVEQYHKLDEKQLGQLCGILQRRIAQLGRSARASGKQASGELARAVDGDDKNCPF